MPKTEKRNVLISTGHIKQIEKLTGEQAKDLLLAICAYQENEKLPDMDAVTDMLFSIFQDEIDENNQKYQETCERNKQIALERERKKRKERERESTNVHERNMDSTTVHDRTRHSTKRTDSDSDNNIKEKVSANADTKEKVGTMQEIISAPSQKSTKKVYGEFSHVKLTQDEYDKLVSAYGESKTHGMIQYLDEYMEDKPKYTSKNHYLAIKRWVSDAWDEKHKPKTKANRGETRTESLDAMFAAGKIGRG